MVTQVLTKTAIAEMDTTKLQLDELDYLLTQTPTLETPVQGFYLLHCFKKISATEQFLKIAAQFINHYILLQTMLNLSTQ